ncbi:MAG: HAD family phosphatase [Pseudobdellovibrionaceae bacterium]
MPRFVFWDCDNTLLENAGHHWLKHKITLKRLGITLPEEQRKIFFQNNGQQNWEWLKANMDFDMPCDSYLKEVDTWYHQHVHEIPLRPGIAWALDYFQQSGAKQCVVTNARRASVEPMLSTKDIARYFEFALCKEDYTSRKPDPMPYLTAIDRMETISGNPIDKAQCLVIEDDPLGVTAANRAGLKVIQRRYQREETPSPDATISLYDEKDFIEALKKS